MGRAEGKANKRIHQLCWSLLQLWKPHPLRTTGCSLSMCSFEACSSHLYHRVRIVQAHVHHGVISPGKIRVGGTMEQYHYQAEKAYLQPRTVYCSYRIGSMQSHQPRTLPLSMYVACFQRARWLPTSRARGHRASQSCHDVDSQVPASLGPAMRHERGKEG